MKIALLDSGININRKEINNKKITQVKTDLFLKNSVDRMGHGTAIAFILQKLIKDVEIISFKLFDENHITIETEILETFQQIYLNYPDIDIIHISSGITYISNYNEFNDICSKINKRGTIIVSAYENEGSVSYPAALKNTVGVYWDKSVKKVNQFYYITNSSVEVLGYAGNMRLPWGKKEYRYVAGSSFAAPYITAKIAAYKKREQSLTLEMVKAYLRNDAVKILNPPEILKVDEQMNHLKAIKNIKKAILFPANKEMQALIGNHDLLSFKITGVFDYKYSSNIYKKTANCFFGESIYDGIILKYEDIQWDEDFDTIILGHVNIISNMAGVNFLTKTLENCLRHNKNCYIFDDMKSDLQLIENIRDNGNFAMTHFIKNFSVLNTLFGSCHKLSSPTLAVVGTSPNQGKYNLQLSLRRRFLSDGYEIGQIGTEPSAQLLGMDLVFSTGYDNQYHLTDEEEILYLNHEIYNLGKKDIILLGTQSNTIPFCFGNIGFLTMHQQNALIALEPDGVVLAINCDDDWDYIRRTIAVIKNYYLASVIAIAVFPFTKFNLWNVNNKISKKVMIEELNNIKRNIQMEFGISTYINGDLEDMNSLYNKCLDFFS